ncbi:MAG: hypothetical protein GKR97_09600 [Rhizobiaceae bacterium]|nr:hypothetical protein [Rhizobiaceae bacterium]
MADLGFSNMFQSQADRLDRGKEDIARIGSDTLRRHATPTCPAEGLFVKIAGQAEWYKEGSTNTLSPSGDRMHHASYQPHASRTTHSDLLAVWVRAGDVANENYNYQGGDAPILENTK